MKRLYLLVLFVLLAGCSTPTNSSLTPRARWTTHQANAWSAHTHWLVGCNFIPSTAVNQLEMWQANTWDPATIDRELSWAESLGFTSLRVFLHDLLWQQDQKGFLARMDQFLALAHQHHLGVTFVLLDSVWDPHPKLGQQPAPRPHLHNSGWVQSPGVAILGDPTRHEELKPYVQGVIGHFRNDKRVDCWDLFNEPDNRTPQYIQFEPKNKRELAVRLLQKVFTWAHEMNPSQPLTSGVWIGQWGDPEKLTMMEKCQLEESDVISFHSYGQLDDARKCVQNLQRYGRPILCTEYMARSAGSRFDPVLGYFKAQHVGAYNWGFVSGKTQTIYPWDSWNKPYTAEPPVWFHDIFHPDGTPYDVKETDYIKSMTGKDRE